MHSRSRENQLRRVARRLGLRLEKSRAFGGYMLVYIERNAVAYSAAGHKGRGYSLTLDGVEAYLKRREKHWKRVTRITDRTELDPIIAAANG